MRFSIFTLNIFAVLRFAFDVCRGNFLCGKFLIFYSFFLLKKGEKAVESAACDAKNLRCAKVGLQRFDAGNILLKANNVA